MDVTHQIEDARPELSETAVQSTSSIRIPTNGHEKPSNGLTEEG
jgi:hypothetical protein